MIRRGELTQIGAFFKPHGIKGEITAELDYGLTPDVLRCVIAEIDGISVPFFVESFRPKGASTWLIKIDGIDDENAASLLVNHDIYAITAELPEGTLDDDGDGIYLYDLIGYTLLDGPVAIGVIDAVDDSTANILLEVKRPDGSTVYVPFAEEWITELNPDTSTIAMELPEGLIDLNA